MKMSAKMKQVIDNIKDLTAQERALVAHCLISSLENSQDEGVDDEWANLAEKRYKELESGKVQGVTWNDMKKDIIG